MATNYPEEKRKQQRFSKGMILEAFDLTNPSVLCVATIMNVDDDKIHLHFEGWGDHYDYTCKMDSILIHPLGWSERSQRPYAPGYKGDERDFHVDDKNKFTAAPEHLFTRAQRSSREFTKGMKLEARDRLNSTFCVATIVKLGIPDFLIHLDGQTSENDYWCQSNSTDIHPVGWCKKNKLELQIPKDYDGSFKWSQYLKESDSMAAPLCLFTKEQGGKENDSNSEDDDDDDDDDNESEREERKLFEIGMKLEAEDKENAALYYVATVSGIHVKSHDVQIQFDGFDLKYYWCSSDSNDIHPVGWCKRKGMNLQPPNGYTDFSWDQYLAERRGIPAPLECFTEEQQD